PLVRSHLSFPPVLPARVEARLDNNFDSVERNIEPRRPHLVADRETGPEAGAHEHARVWPSAIAAFAAIDVDDQPVLAVFDVTRGHARTHDYTRRCRAVSHRGPECERS